MSTLALRPDLSLRETLELIRDLPLAFMIGGDRMRLACFLLGLDLALPAPFVSRAIDQMTQEGIIGKGPLTFIDQLADWLDPGVVGQQHDRARRRAVFMAICDVFLGYADEYELSDVRLGDRRPQLDDGSAARASE